MNKRAILSSFIGNTLEFYDFVQYGALGGLFTILFFSNSDFLSTLFLNGVSVFSIGLIARPLGGLICLGIPTIDTEDGYRLACLCI